MTRRLLAAALAALLLPLAGCGDDEGAAPGPDAAPVEFRKVLTSSHLDGGCRVDAAVCAAWADFSCPGDAEHLDGDLLMVCGTGKDADQPYLLSASEIVGGVAGARAGNRRGAAQWEVELQLDEEATRAFAELTAELVRTYAPIGIVLDDVVLAAPAVQQPVSNGVVRLAGDYTEDEAEALADRLAP